MEKQNPFMSQEAPIWNPSCFLMEMQSCNNPYWENSIDQSDPFESALSSIVSSPVATPIHGGGSDASMIRELLGKLENFSNSDTKNYNNNNNNINKPLMLNNSQINNKRVNLVSSQSMVTPINADPEFVERAARFSRFGDDGLNQQFSSQLSENMVSGANTTSHSIKINGGSTQVNGQETIFNGVSVAKIAEFGDSREGSSISEQIPGGELSIKGNNAGNDGNSRKRKSVSRGKATETPQSSSLTTSDAKNVESGEKRSKIDGAKDNEKDEQKGNQKQIKENLKPEPPKDYIHVRARRGQATDSHSLAERVRREKISERMKFLQDLVPGCNKVTGKAVMLDEIINYVQSLQRQVEFLSMKLATVNPRLDFNVEALVSKSPVSIRNNLYPLESAIPYNFQALQQGLPLQNCTPSNVETQFSTNPLNSVLEQNQIMQFPPLGGFGVSAHQVTGFWEDDLHNVVQMGYSGNPQGSIPGSLYAVDMKMEL